jgi:hypothetical protein
MLQKPLSLAKVPKSFVQSEIPPRMGILGTTGAHLPSLNPKKPNVTKTLKPGQITKALLIQKIPPRMGMLRTIGAQLPSINPKKKMLPKP